MGSIRCEEYFWGTPPDSLGPPFDFIIGTDVVYREDIIDPLIQSLLLLSTKNTTILIANEMRSKR